MCSYTAFLGGKQIGSGKREELTKLLVGTHPYDHQSILVFEDETGRITDLDYRGVMKGDARRSPGRPKLGVQSREVTLLPRHWDWLAQQPGGASAALRRLVDAARSNGLTQRQRQDAAYRFMQAACGDMSGYEEALRALYRSEGATFATAISNWPEDIQSYILKLLGLGTLETSGASCE
jgi:hypothetical protein